MGMKTKQAPKSLIFNTKTKKPLKDMDKYVDDFIFLYNNGYLREAGKLALTLGEANSEYLYKVYDIADELYQQGDYRFAATFYHSLYDYTSDDYTSNIILEKAAKSYEKAIEKEIREQGEDNFVKFLRVQLGSVYEHLNELDKSLDVFIKAGAHVEAIRVIDKMLKDDKYKPRYDELRKLRDKYMKEEKEKGNGSDMGYRDIIKNMGRIVKV